MRRGGASGVVDLAGVVLAEVHGGPAVDLGAFTGVLVVIRHHG